MQYEHAKMLGGTSSPTPAFYALELKAVMCKNGLIGSDESIIVFFPSNYAFKQFPRFVPIILC